MKEWIITSNLNRFDVIGAFKKFYKINREQKIKRKSTIGVKVRECFCDNRL